MFFHVCDSQKYLWSIHLTDLTLGLNLPESRLIHPLVH
jgi:hypothetical protein